ncbi:MAG: LysM peptidoglycan-binding domain-containing protein, partial [Deltaproteobacteria bacterium]
MEATATPTPRPFHSARAFTPRPQYQPGELVPYTAQTGDTLPALAAHFNTTIEEIRTANASLNIPADVTTLPPGMPMQIPIYYLPDWGTPYQILPDSLFVNGPAQVGFDTADFVAQSAGWLREYRAYAAGETRSGAEIVDYVAQHFSISPRLLLALLEYQSGALTQPDPGLWAQYPLRYEDAEHKGVYLQLVWAADRLNDGYYRWRAGLPVDIRHADGTHEQPDPWQNAATVGLHTLFASLEPQTDFWAATAPEGFAATYASLFGDPWQADQPHIPVSLRQPLMQLPFEPGKTWAYTGGPHTAWGTGQPWAAIDFAPPSTVSGCSLSDEWGVAVADGVVAYVEPGVVELDLDGDGDPRTGWVVFY